MYKSKFKKNSGNKNFKRRGRSKSPIKRNGLDLNKYISDGSKVSETKKYETVHTFSDFMLDAELQSKIEQKGFTTPAEIQDKAIPKILEGKDIIGVAGTGTGKTAAFLIPIIQEMIENKRDRYSLIIAPTRELANQINDEFRSLSKGMGIFSTCLIGGSSVYESIKSLKRTNHLVIGTPGRLMDMNRQGKLKFDQFKVLVLDEFDRMLDMGFKDEMREINEKMTNKTQTLLFSATIEKSQKSLMFDIAGDAEQIRAAVDTQKTDAIKQDVLHVKGKNKFEMMSELLTDSNEDKTILFCETKRNAEKMVKQLRDKSIRADAIHGDKSQRAREIALRKFKRGQVNVLVATDVVARGIDVSDVSLVINYEVPRSYTDYVHRIGRTGRAGKSGRAITLID